MISFDAYLAELGSRIRTKRSATGMSLRTFGDMVGVHYNQLQRIESGQVNPSMSTLYRIADGLGVDVADLLRD